MRQSIENKMLEAFYEYPDKEFTVREVAKLTNLPRATAHKYLISFRKNGLITKNNSAEHNLLFKVKKINYYIEKIVSSGLVNYLIDKLNPSCIILFGSIRKGDSIRGSDVDLFIESSLKRELNLKSFESKIGHKIELFIESNINKLNKNLFNNVVNGIKIYGSFEIK